MRFFETVLTGAALVAAALAVTIDTFPSSVVAGQTYTITYSPKDNTPTTFILRQGPSGNLNTIDTLTTTATGGSFTWTVPKTLPNEPNYAFQIKQGDDSNYSAQFPLTGGAAAVSSAASSAASTARPSASASSAASASGSVSGSVTSMRPSASILPSSGSNSTVASATLSVTRASTMTSSVRATGSATGSAGVPQNSAAAGSMIAQPMAAVFGAFAAFAYLA